MTTVDRGCPSGAFRVSLPALRVDDDDEFITGVAPTASAVRVAGRSRFACSARDGVKRLYLPGPVSPDSYTAATVAAGTPATSQFRLNGILEVLSRAVVVKADRLSFDRAVEVRSRPIVEAGELPLRLEREINMTACSVVVQRKAISCFAARDVTARVEVIHGYPLVRDFAAEVDIFARRVVID